MKSIIFVKRLKIFMIIKRIIDIFFSFSGILILSPLISISCLLIFMQDWHSPFYIAKRVGKNGKLFNMIKLRSMIINADNNKVDSTAKNDPRITNIGKLIRKLKLDELSQLYNVLVGDMSLVGPRPNVQREVDLYTELEEKLINVKPGITDFASIVFFDESEILENKEDPDLAYNQLIRPWKSKLGLFYIQKKSIIVDLLIIIITIISLFSRKLSLKYLQLLSIYLNAPKDLSRIILRKDKLYPSPPPGSNKIVTSRNDR